MILIELSGPAAEPVSVAEAKEWSRIDRTDEDGVIARLIAAARESVEQRTGLVIGPRRFRLVLDSAATRSVKAGRRPVSAVTGVLVYGRDGEPQARVAGEVQLSGEDGFLLSPELHAAARGGLEIEFEAGLEADVVPETVKIAMLRIVAASYETRGLVGAEMQPAIVPPLAAALLLPYRRIAL